MSREEVMMYDIPANLFRGLEGVGGRLKITKSRIRFEPHMFNVQTEILELKIKDIKKIEKRNNLFIIPNGIKITLKNGNEHKFVLWKRDEIIKYIIQRIHHIKKIQKEREAQISNPQITDNNTFPL